MLKRKEYFASLRIKLTNELSGDLKISSLPSLSFSDLEASR